MIVFLGLQDPLLILSFWVLQVHDCLRCKYLFSFIALGFWLQGLCFAALDFLPFSLFFWVSEAWHVDYSVFPLIQPSTFFRYLVLRVM